MCDQTPLEYREGSVVWVKLGACWWPGEVVAFEELPAEVKESLQKPPLVCVKFFDEDNFEFVRNLNSIYSYNCSKKYDFIKKGLRLHQAKHSFMEKFPSDISKAEVRTDGNPDILNDPRCLPSKKPDFDAIFGTPSQKKTSSGRGRPPSTKSPKRPPVVVTHRRFLGDDNHVVRELIQSPLKQPRDTQTHPENDYRCHTCDFRSSRIDVIVMHHKLHIQGEISPLKKQKKKSGTSGSGSSSKKVPKSQRISFSRTSTIDEDIALLSKGLLVCSDSSDDLSDEEDEEEEVKAKKRKKKVKGTRGRKKAAKSSPSVASKDEKKKDIQKDILAEWDDDDEEEEEEKSKADGKSDKEVPSSEAEESKTEDTSSKEIEESTSKLETEEEPKGNKSNADSCFDFNEEEEELGTTVEGRKIPRVIPKVEKRKSLEEEKEPEQDEETREEDKDIEGEENKVDDVKENENEDLSKDLKEIDSVLEECSVPVLPEVPQSRSLSIDSKSSSSDFDAEKMIVATKLTNPKKRFAKNFEDETKNSKGTEEEKKAKDKPSKNSKEPPPEEVKEEKSIKDPANVELSKLKTQLMQKLGDGKSMPEPETKKKRKTFSVLAFSDDDEEEIPEYKVESKRRRRSTKEKSSPVLSSPPPKECKDDEEEEEEEVKNDEKKEMPKQIDVEPKKEPELEPEPEPESEPQPEPEPESELEPEIENKPNEENNVEETKEEKTVSMDETIPEIEQTETPEMETPEIETPEMETPEMETPEMETPEMKTPEMETPEMETPEMETPEMETPEIETPETETPTIEEPTLPDIPKEIIPTMPEQSDFVDIEANFTIVSEKDLADKQVEITAIPKVQKAVTLSSFSLDFCEDEKKDSTEEEKSSSEEKEQEKPEPVEEKIEPEDKEESKSESEKGEEAVEEKGADEAVIKEVKVPVGVEEVKESDETPPPVIEMKAQKTEEAQKKEDKSETEGVHVKKVTAKRSYQDIEDIDTFIIKKPVKKVPVAVVEKGKPRILQQTIITPSGDIIQPGVTQTQEDLYDINSMPIVLGDQILAPESVPVKKPVPSTVTTSTVPMKLLNKTPITTTVSKVLHKKATQKVYQTTSTKLLKPSIITQHGKPGKFIIVPSTSSQPTGSKYTVGKRGSPGIIKKPQKLQMVNPTTTGNKIMILTDSQGQQQKVLLTPEQQKQLIGGPKKRIVQKGANIISQTIVSSKGQVTTSVKRPILKAGPSGQQQQRTIIIKNPQGQTVKKMQSTSSDDTILNQQVAEQLQAINRAASGKNQLKPTVRPPAKKSYVKKEVAKTHQQAPPPPLAPISPKKKSESSEESGKKPQFVIRDGNGALININEGQILALPSEAIDGQPQSYVLVTIDESGNLTPLNSEALMSLDPNLNLGNAATIGNPEESEVKETTAVTVPKEEVSEGNVQAVVNAGDMGQLIITGDPVSTQKFLDSLSEGNTDLANLLSTTDGNVLIQVNQDGSESSGNPVFSGQTDILAAALADTDVSISQSQLSPNSGLFPINVGNVLETNTMSSPIMTPLEVPSTNNKKIGDENDILNQDPKNEVLPITITDPSISQTASQHQVASLIGADLQANLELPMSSPSFVYSLPTLDDTDINQKSFPGSISMPLLTEEDAKEPEEQPKEEEPKEEAQPPKEEVEEMCNSLSEPPPDMFEFASEMDSTSSSVISSSDKNSGSDFSCEIPLQDGVIMNLGENGTSEEPSDV